MAETRDTCDDGITQAERPAEPYSILHGAARDTDASEEGQGRRAARHMGRIEQAYRLGRTRIGALKQRAEDLEADLERTRNDLKTAERDRDKDCLVDRLALAAWVASAPQFHKPAEPRNKTMIVGDLALDVRQKAVPEKLTLTDQEAVMRQCPDFVRYDPHLRWVDLKATLTPTPHGVITEQGEIIEGVAWTKRETVDDSAVLLEGKRIPLRALPGEDVEPDQEQGGETDEAE
jgi:hypothetical protein